MLDRQQDDQSQRGLCLVTRSRGATEGDCGSLLTLRAGSNTKALSASNRFRNPRSGPQKGHTALPLSSAEIGIKQSFWAGIAIGCVSNVISVAGGAQREAERLHGRESLFLQVLGKREKSKKPQLKKKKEPSKKTRKGFYGNSFSGRSQWVG